MARKQIRVYVEDAQWELLRRDGESDTEMLQRILSEYLEVFDQLKAIDQNISVAVGRCLQSYEILKEMKWVASPTTTPTPDPVAPADPADPEFQDDSGEW